MTRAVLRHAKIEDVTNAGPGTCCSLDAAGHRNRGLGDLDAELEQLWSRFLPFEAVGFAVQVDQPT
jgi:hypothetical protein